MTQLPTPKTKESLAGYVLSALVALNLLLHLPFLLMEVFGEGDAARLALVSLQLAYHQEGPLQIFQDPIYSAPLYVALLRLGIESGLIHPANIIAWMTTASYIASAVVTAALYIFIFQLSGSNLAASGAGLLLQLNPTFWFNSIYGFPTILAIAFLLLALVLFQSGLAKTRGVVKAALAGSAFILFGAATLVKIDAFLAGVVLYLPVWQSASRREHRLIWLAAMLGLGLGSFGLYSLYTGALLSGQQAFTFYDVWNLRFPFDMTYFLSRANLEIIFRSAGVFSIPAAILASYFLAKDHKLRSALFWIATSALIVVVFWGVREGNSARHNLLPAVFVVMLLALPLATRVSARWGIILAVMCFGNYFILPPQANTTSPSGRLAANSTLLREARLGLHQTGRAISNLQEDKMALIGNGPVQPYYLFEIFRNENYAFLNAQPYPETRLSETHFLYQGKPRAFLWSYYSLPIEEIVRIIHRGYFAIIDDSRAATELEKIMNGDETRWLSIQDVH